MLEKGYSKGLLGGLTNAFDNAQLSLIGGDLDGRIAKARHYREHLPIINVPESRMGELKKKFPELIRTMVFADKRLRDETYIDAFGGHDFRHLPAIAAGLALHGGDSTGTVVRTVFGGSIELPFRALSYILPGLTYLGNMQDVIDNIPQFQIVLATNISSQIDKLDQRKAQAEASQFVSFASAYIDSFFPKIADKVVFLHDKPLTSDGQMVAKLCETLATLTEVANQDTKDRLVLKGESNGGKEQAFLYGAAHSLVHDVRLPNSLQPFVAEATVIDPHSIISIGGHQEKSFYELRSQVKPHLPDSIPTLQYFTRHRVPPYYKARGGEVSLTDVLKGHLPVTEDIDATARYDINYFYRVSMSRGDVESFLDNYRRRIA